MSSFTAHVHWERDAGDFLQHQYSRAHEWSFDGGLTVPASASPDIVPLPLSCAENVDPEEAFVASLASCHMLFFLDIAAQKGYVVDSYDDRPVGKMRKNSQGRFYIGKVTLHPEVRFSGETLPQREQSDEIHALAHEECFIANSVLSELTIEPR